MKTIIPSGLNLFAKPTEKQTVSESGFIMSEDSLEKPRTATVISVGAKVTSFKPGDVIVYKIYATTDYKLGDEDYFLIAEEDVLGVLVDKD